MRVDKDDRYVSEQPKKDSTPSLKLPTFLHEFSKTKLIIVSLAIVIILLLLSLTIFRSNPNKEPTPLTPPAVNGVSSTDVNSNDPQINEQNVVNENTQTETSSSTTDSQSGVTPINRPPEVEASSGTIDGQNSNSTPIIPNETNSTINTQHVENTRTNLENDHYTIQLSASSSAENLKKFVKQHKIVNYQIYETKRNNQPWFILIQGNYPSSNEAKKAIKSLPKELQKDKPWVRPGATINKEKIIK